MKILLPYKINHHHKQWILFCFIHFYIWSFFHPPPTPSTSLSHPCPMGKQFVPCPQFLLSIKSQDFSLDLELGDHLDYNHQEKKLGDPPSQPALLPLLTTTQIIFLHSLTYICFNVKSDLASKYVDGHDWYPILLHLCMLRCNRFIHNTLSSLSMLQ